MQKLILILFNKILKCNVSIWIIICLLSNSCKEKENPFTYSDCCTIQPYEYSIDNAKLYMPNVFSPNFDGINDILMPFTNDSVTSIDNFEIRDAFNNQLLYFKNMCIPNNVEDGWSAILPDGTLFVGKVKFSFQAKTITSKMIPVEGVACAIRCEPDSKSLQTNKNCHFPDQAEYNGTYYTGLKQLNKETSEQFCN